MKKIIKGSMAIGTGYPIYTSVRNTKAMNQLIQDGLGIFSRHFTVKELDAGELGKIRIYGIMTFKVKKYQIEGVGNLSIMTVNIGVMQMLSFVVTPLKKDLPLMSADYIFTLSKRKAILDFYDLTENSSDPAYQEILKELSQIHAGYSDLKNAPRARAWYDDLMTISSSKTGRAREDMRLQKLFTDSAECFAKFAAVSPELDDTAKEKKRSLIRDYANGLVDKGGLSTDVFKKCLGAKKTKEFFKKVFFGYDTDI